jgi:hypothetical protein
MNRSWLTAETERGFAFRFAILAGLLLTVPWLAHLIAGNDGPARLAPAATAAVIVIVSFIWWRREALLAFALFVLFYDTLALYMGGQTKRFDEMTVPGLVLISAWHALPDWRRWSWWPRELALMLAVSAGVVSSLVARVPLEIWGIQLVLMVKAIAIFYVAMWLAARTFEIAAGMKIVLAIGALILALGLVELINPPVFQEALGLHSFVHARGPLYSVKSLFFHPVLFSWFTAFVALYAYAWYLVTRRRLALVVAALFSLGPFLGQRRRAIGALIAGLITAFAEFLIRRRTSWRSVVRRFAPVAATMTLILMIFIPMLSNLLDSTIQNYIVTPTPSAGESPGDAPDAGEAPPQVRVALYLGSLKVARDDFPLGGGLGRWGSWMSRVEYSPLYYEYEVDTIRGLKPSNPVNATDTFWPQIVGELGVIGALGYIGFLACLALGLWRAAARHSTGILRIFALGTGMILAQAVIESFASPMFHSPPRAYLLFMVIGVATALQLPPPAGEAPADELSDNDGHGSPLGLQRPSAS